MRREILATAAGGLLLGAWTAAEPLPRAELFGGYALLKSEGESLHGWDAAGSFRLRGRLALVVDASGQYGTLAGVDASRASLAAGPGFALFRSARLALQARALFGLVRDSASLQVLDVRISESHSGFGLLLGGSLDLRVTDALALRLFQADWVHSERDGSGRDEARFAAGLVLRLGR